MLHYCLYGQLGFLGWPAYYSSHTVLVSVESQVKRVKSRVKSKLRILPPCITTAGLLLKLSRVGPGQSLDETPDAAGSGVGGPVGCSLSSGLKNAPGQ
jgi:hypothetical protein